MKKLLSFFFLLGITLTVFSQNIQVQGVIVSGQDNEPLPGVNVVVKGTANGTITGLDGRFSLNVPSNCVLLISYVGYKSQDVAVKGARSLRVVLQEDTEALDEVIVVGYGVQKKSVVTAAISRVSADELNTTRPSRVEDALKGKVSGVQITQSSGQPGSDSKVRIRGIGTINNSDPLYIVDGMAIDGGISYLNPLDIQSVEILKDAASGAIYGARAANGVVLVTTKSGQSGKTSINYDFSYGWQRPWKEKEVLNAQQYMTIMNEMDVNDGGTATYDLNSFKGNGTNWQKETFNYDAPVQNHQVSINGGSDKVQYFLSFGYFTQDGIVGGDYGKSNYERYSVRSNSTYTVFETKERNFLNKIRAGVNMSYSRAKSTGIETNSEYGSVLGSAASFSPLVSVYATDEAGKQILADHPTAVVDANGRVFSLPPSGYQELANPLAQLSSPTNTFNNEDKFVGTFWAELDVLPGLKFKSSYGSDLAFWGSDGYSYEYYMGSMKQSTNSWVNSALNRGYRWQIENTLSYNKTFAEKHNLSVVLGQSASKYTVRNLSGTDYDLFSTDPSKANINSGIADRDKERVDGGTNGFDFESLASYFGRVDYNYAERYMLQATVRRDGSSHFGPKNKWATFPAFSLGWNLSNEPYMQNIPDWVNLLKFRFSWGKNGNQSIGNFRYTALLDGGQNYYYGGSYDAASNSKGGAMQYGTSPAALPNADIKWEESQQVDLGFDTRLFKSAMNFSVDYFKKKTNGMLMEQPIPGYVGFGAPTANAGKMQNWGLEFELGWKHSIGDFNYSLSANATYMKNELIDLGNDSGMTVYESAGASGLGDYVKAENGEVFPYFYGKKTAGIFQNQQEIDEYVNSDGTIIQPNAKPGDVRFVDLDDNGKIDDGDKTKIGKGMPDWTFGFTVTADYKNFDLNLFFQGSLGNDIYDFCQRADIPRMNRPEWYMDRWHGEGTSNRIPRVTSSDTNGNWSSSDLYVHDGSYMRLKTAQLGYTLPIYLTRKVSVQKLRIYVAAENLLTLTGYKGFDPEIASGSYTTIGIDRGIYPQARTISVGANISF
ncbi:TonB-dependent receptor [uncultured Bacteroides sp.]|uniref:SusC/RagA family TonB-linked outer membrane protein n=1 Tax=uncultured Bacteroides sp. TaxID=162156 RepID=UPI002AA8AC46|nr:TonB-dependent receptor [uncultured Bacteroides sp.]